MRNLDFDTPTCVHTHILDTFLYLLLLDSWCMSVEKWRYIWISTQTWGYYQTP